MSGIRLTGRDWGFSVALWFPSRENPNQNEPPLVTNGGFILVGVPPLVTNEGFILVGVPREALWVGLIRCWLPRGGKKDWVDPMSGAYQRQFGLGGSEGRCLWEALRVGCIRWGATGSLIGALDPAFLAEGHRDSSI